MKNLRFTTALTLSIAVVGGAAASVAVGADSKTTGRVGPSLGITGNGRALTPAGRVTTVGNFPSGSALTPDGRFLWTVSSGHGRNDVTIVKVSDGTVTQTLPLPGAYGGVAISPDGTHAYVSGEPAGNSTPVGTVKAPGGDAIHVYTIDVSGQATEGTPIALPLNPGGDKSWPAALTVTPDGNKLVAVEIQARFCLTDTSPCTGGSLPTGKLAVINLSNSAVTELPIGIGTTLHGVAVSPDSSTAYVTDEKSGVLDIVNLTTGNFTSVGVGGPANGDGTGDKFSHPEGVAVTPDGNSAYVAVANRDLVAKVNISTKDVTYTSVGRTAAWGTQPVALTIAGNRLYVADSGEDAIAVLDISGSTPVLAGRVPTAAYPTGVSVTPDGTKLIWTAAKGLGAGANPLYGTNFASSESAPYGQYVPDMLLGRVGVLAVPTTEALATLTTQADAQLTPANFTVGPPNTALKANGPIKHVFYIVRENRTYDQIFGKDTRGDGDPNLQVFGDNGTTGATGGVTPNAHALTRRFPLLDHFYANSEVSVDGHIITSMGTAIDYSQRALHANYANRGRLFDFIYPISFAPKVSIFDQAVRQGVSAINYGENESGSSVVCSASQGPSCKDSSDDGRSTYAAVKAANDRSYPQTFGCAADPTLDKALKKATLLNSKYCEMDSSANGLKHKVFSSTIYHSRLDYWRDKFATQLAANSVPALTYLTFVNDHTNGVKAGIPTPKALVADNDLAIGQFIETLSKSKIWSESAVFIVEDDSQDGADHVDAHRMPAFVISPWAKKGAVVHTRYDQNSALRSAMLLLGLNPLTLGDALATPMYDAFARTTDTPDTAKYTAIKPKYSLTSVTSAGVARAAGKLAAALPYESLDMVPQQLFDQVIWQSVFGPHSKAPVPGPNASPTEIARAHGALRALRTGKNVSQYLRSVTPKRDILDNGSKVGTLRRARDK
ncbi:MAG: alkaline phosphatase family protein [Actinomycetes bacterium]